MDEPLWVDEATASAIHGRQLAEHGGTAGLRSRHLLSSALARPRHRYIYGAEVDLAALAAAYAVGIVADHPFVDGNKRTAYVVTRLFLVLNGHDIDAAADEKYLSFYGLAAGDVNEDQLAQWLRARLRAR